MLFQYFSSSLQWKMHSFHALFLQCIVIDDISTTLLFIFFLFFPPPEPSSRGKRHFLTNLNGFFALWTHDQVARQDHLVVAIVARFSGPWMMWRSDYSLLPCSSAHSLERRSFSRRCATALSPCGLSFQATASLSQRFPLLALERRWCAVQEFLQ